MTIIQAESEIKIRHVRYVYPYGKFYNPNTEEVPKRGKEIIIYNTSRGLQNENRIIGSLEGIFVSCKNLSGDTSLNFYTRRDQMKEFEIKYNGKFISFGKE